MRKLTCVAFALLVGAAESSEAQGVVALECLPQRVKTLNVANVSKDWSPFFPDSVTARSSELLAVGRYSEGILLAVEQSLRAVVRVGDATRRDALRQRIERVRDGVRVLERGANDLGKRSSTLATVVPLTDFMVQQNPATGAVTIGGVAVLDVDTDDTRRGLCWSALSMHAVLSTYVQPALESTAAALAGLSQRWDAYSEGYSQLPWELALNSRRYDMVKQRYQPPTFQLVALHPSAGVQLAGATPRDVRRIDVAMLEVVGFVRYSSDYQRYWGFSALGTVATSASPTYGVLAHLWWPNMAAGVTFGAEKGSARPSYVVSVDLFGIITGTPAKLRELASAAKAGARSSTVR